MKFSQTDFQSCGRVFVKSSFLDESPEPLQMFWTAKKLSIDNPLFLMSRFLLLFQIREWKVDNRRRLEKQPKIQKDNLGNKMKRLSKWYPSYFYEDNMTFCLRLERHKVTADLFCRSFSQEICLLYWRVFEVLPPVLTEPWRDGILRHSEYELDSRDNNLYHLRCIHHERKYLFHV